ncbi:Heat shock protein. Metallo peptidase. MEROPS family M48B [Desulfacinum infernum DSM 9756]|uniref:Protease HtpX homolog n=1 Tax=Desulfacinum infernum DSM 9756 TaxID=1121391 RepID=A0A1M5AD62_9BACT|nr:zinc metalloprotease HtpX [Desulfacinum infernum]SHF28281.1 Heat shock protein. Metallo peptidase. MEROPS family M48B [Desulfacinum infernum DSM 9756]
MGNRFRTTLLLAALTVLIVGIGRLLGGPQGMAIALVFAVVMNFGTYWFSDKIVLAMYRAQPVDEREAPELYNMVRELAASAGLPMPRVYIIPSETPNAFATGRNPEHAVVAVTEGLLRLLSAHEVRGVLAHELAHIKNRDILIGTIAAAMAGAVMFLADMARWTAIFGGFRGNDEEGEGAGGLFGTLVLAIVAPIAAMLIQMAISRSREYLADETGARIAGHPESLASALEKLAVASERIPMVEAKPATAHMFIVNPLSGRSLVNLFSTHPPIEERIRRLRSFAY